MSDSRIEFESKVAILEHTVDALSTELAVQQRRLDALQASLDALVRQVHRLRSGGDAIEPHDTRPPHWGG
ncbi:MAG: SlyX family protein [Planctomycetes bacterium]|nr:SlyX family protein [Planctomycetota bacterium]MCB9886214.1 SlyX family protein [Planctomycetota bacterium]